MAKIIKKIWFGLGAVSLVGIGGSGVWTTPGKAQHAHGQPPAATVQPKPADAADALRKPDGSQLAAPQGGEAYLTDGGPKDTRIRIYRDIALMRGHLLVGQELIEQGLWDEALPHFLHPTEELYGAMERYIKLHKVTPFDRQLKAQAQAVKAKNMPAYQQAAKVVDQRLANALDAFKRFMTVEPFSSYTARTVVELLKVAQAEYAASIENGAFAKPVEYQDGRGFVGYAEQLLARHQREFEAVDRERFAALRAMLTDMKSAWPTAVPPAQPVTDAAALAAKVEAFASAAERFF